MSTATSGRTAVVTGASSGIGAATARSLAAAGLSGRLRRSPGDRVARLADEIGGVAVTCDVTRDADVAALAEAAGPVVHVLVNNAGGAHGLEPVAEADLDAWQTMFDVNVLGVVRVTKALLPALVAAGDGIIVNVGSTAGRIAYEGGAGYTAAKHGLAVVTETLRLELFDQPVRVTEIEPGMVRTDEFALTRFGGDRDRAEQRVCGGRRSPRRRGRRGRDHLDGDPTGPRQRGPPRHQAARPGGAPQGRPEAERRPETELRRPMQVSDPLSETVFTYAAPRLKFGSGASSEIAFEVTALGARIGSSSSRTPGSRPPATRPGSPPSSRRPAATPRCSPRSTSSRPTSPCWRPSPGPRARAVRRDRRGGRRLDDRHREGGQPPHDERGRPR
jgi:NADP-dependent 3-hydroxy acid dehydrogenase YdfG